MRYCCVKSCGCSSPARSPGRRRTARADERDRDAVDDRRSAGPTWSPRAAGPYIEASRAPSPTARNRQRRRSHPPPRRLRAGSSRDRPGADGAEHEVDGEAAGQPRSGRRRAVRPSAEGQRLDPRAERLQQLLKAAGTHAGAARGSRAAQTISAGSGAFTSLTQGEADDEHDHTGDAERQASTRIEASTWVSDAAVASKRDRARGRCHSAPAGTWLASRPSPPARRGRAR